MHGVCVYFALLLQIGLLKRSGNGRPVEPELKQSVETLRSRRRINNRAAISERLKEGKFAEQLYQMCENDCQKGWVKGPYPLHHWNLEEFSIAPHFGVDQGKITVTKSCL